MGLAEAELGEHGVDEPGLGGLLIDGLAPSAVEVGRRRGEGREGGGGAAVLGGSGLGLP